MHDGQILSYTSARFIIDNLGRSMAYVSKFIYIKRGHGRFPSSFPWMEFGTVEAKNSIV